MRRLPLPILAVLCCAFIIPETVEELLSPGPEGRRKAGLRGNVRMVTMQRWDVLRDTPRLEEKTVVVYDRRGNRVREERYDARGALERCRAWTYDGRGFLDAETKTDGAGKVRERRRYGYDGQGRLRRQEDRGADGRVVRVVETEYGADGALVAESLTMPGSRDAARSTYRRETRGKDVLVSRFRPDGTLEFTMKLDPRGRLVEGTAHANDGSRGMTWRRVFDAFGHAAEGTWHEADGRLYMRYAWNADGALVEEATYGGGKLVRRETLRYDSAGRLLERRHTYHGDAVPHHKVTRYVNDRRGNPVVGLSFRLQDADGKPEERLTDRCAWTYEYDD